MKDFLDKMEFIYDYFLFYSKNKPRFIKKIILLKKSVTNNAPKADILDNIEALKNIGVKEDSEHYNNQLFKLKNLI